MWLLHFSLDVVVVIDLQMADLGCGGSVRVFSFVLGFRNKTCMYRFDFILKAGSLWVSVESIVFVKPFEIFGIRTSNSYLPLSWGLKSSLSSWGSICFCCHLVHVQFESGKHDEWVQRSFPLALLWQTFQKHPTLASRCSESQ